MRTPSPPPARLRPALAAAFGAAALFLGSRAAPADDLVAYFVPEAPPELSLPDPHGHRHQFPDYRGKVILLNFWASWCSGCAREIPSLRTLRQRLEGEPFEVLAVNVEENPFRVDKFTRLLAMPFPVLLDRDGAFFNAWGAQVLPTSYLLDVRGQVRYRVWGPLDWASDDVMDVVRGLLAEPRPDAGPARAIAGPGAADTRVSGVPER